MPQNDYASSHEALCPYVPYKKRVRQDPVRRLKLSWPHGSSHRRAIVSGPTVRSRKSSLESDDTAFVHTGEACFVHTSSWDIELHDSLTNDRRISNRPVLNVPLTFNFSKVNVVEKDLLHHCMFTIPRRFLYSYYSFQALIDP